MQALSAISSLPQYLKVYGPHLTRKAIKSLYPLHVPGKDPLPDFDDYPDDRTPLEAQQHVAAGMIKCLDKHGAGFLIGEPGCIAGESEIYDPVAMVYRRVDQITEPFNVVSHKDGRSVIGRAHVPVRKASLPLYRVTLSNGHSFVAAAHHEVLTSTGFRHVSTMAEELRAYADVLLPSIQESCRRASRRDAEHSSRKPSGSRDGCQKYHHSCGERLPTATDIGQEPFLQQGDALAHSLALSQMDGRDCGPEYSRPCPPFGHPSMQDSSSRGSYGQADESESHACETPCGPGESRDQGGRQFLSATCLPRTIASFDQSASQFDSNEASQTPFGEAIGESVSIVKIEYERTDIYYDFTVDVYHNYVMAGVVHHNCGKTITAVATIHEHAKRSRRKGGRNGRYRAIIICPDHLINKWVQEIETTILDARVITIKKWSEILDLVGDNATTRKSRANPVTERTSWVSTADDTKLAKAAKGDDFEKARSLVSAAEVKTKRETFAHQENKRWTQGWDAEWLVLGRDQIKRGPEFCGLTESGRGIVKIVEIDRREVIDDNGRPIYLPGPGYRRKTKGIFEKRARCPRCGKIPTEDGHPISMVALAKKQTTCTGLLLRDLTKDGYGNDVLYEGQDYRSYKGVGEGAFPSHARRLKPGSKLQHAGKSWIVEKCGEPLYQWTRKPDRWPVACIVQKKMRKWAQYLIVDEAHEQKSDVSAQATAMGKVLGTTQYCLAMTGTFIGGYADHLFPLLLRMAGGAMKERGFQWGSKMPFVERYGCIDRIIRGTTSVQATGVVRGSKSLRKAKIGPVTESRKPRPGIMPTLFSHLVMPRSIFLKLDQFIDDLAGLRREAHRGQPAARGPVCLQRGGQGADRCQLGDDREREYETFGCPVMDPIIISRFPVRLASPVRGRARGRLVASAASLYQGKLRRRGDACQLYAGHRSAERAGHYRLVEGAGEQERAALDLYAAHAQALAGRASQVPA